MRTCGGDIAVFTTVDTCLRCENTARQSCAMVARWRIFGDFFASCISASRLQHIQTCILNSHWKKRRQKKPQDKKYNGLPYWTAIKRVNIYSVRKQNTLDDNSNMHNITDLTRMWANAQRDGRPAEHRWRPLFNASKFG